MNINRIIVTMLVVMFAFGADAIAQEMKKKDWEQQMQRLTSQRNQLQERLNRLNGEIDGLTGQAAQLASEITACEDELLALLGITREQLDAFDRELRGYESRADELLRLSDADLVKHHDEIHKMDRRVKEMSASKVGKITRFRGRLSALANKIESLKNTLAKSITVYTVGTWAKDRDCLWNIAKKPTVYGNAWLWPRIWQGNRDKIKDPDLIYPGWRLNIPAGKEMTKEEKAAANEYYRRKAAGG